MSIDEQKLALIERFRIPLDDPSSPMDWKDWYHYVLLDPQTGFRVLVNMTAIARPGQGEIQTSFLVTLPSDLLPPEHPRETLFFHLRHDFFPRMEPRES